MSDLVALVTQHGVTLLFVITLLVRLGAPLPGAPVLMVAGALSVTGGLSLTASLAAALLANVLADGVWFIAGRRHGHRILRLLCRISISPDSCVRQSEAYIGRWGGNALIAAKFVPGVSVVAAPMAGALAMPVGTFLLYETAGALIWSALYLGLGVAFSGQIDAALALMSRFSAIAALVLGAAALGYLAYRLRRRQLFLRQIAMARVSVDELQRMIRDGLAPIVVDVRSEAGRAVDSRRIPGALAAALEEIPRLALTLSRDHPVVLYCNCPNEASAASAAGLLAERGFTSAHPLAGGLDAWVAAGHAVDEPVGALVAESA